MTLTQLRHFIGLAKAGSFVKASGQLFMTQPALSRSIKSLEDELGQLLAALCPLAMRGHALGAVQDGGPQGVHAGLALQQVGEVQFGTPAKQATIVA